MDSFVIMPNHVHAVVEPYQETSLSDLLQSWKAISAKGIAQRTGRTGPLWMPESFDHIVRNVAALQRYRRYILENPKRAKLRVGQYTLWRAPVA